MAPNVAQLEGEDMTHSEQINELAAALSVAQGEIENATKGSSNPHFKSKYADLAEIINAVRPVFSAHGLAYTQCPSYESGIVSVETVLMHKSGQFMSSTISAPVSKQDAQGVGSAITYCRRYSLAAVAGVGQEDDDGNAAVGGKDSTHRQRSNGASQVPKPEDTPTYIKPADLAKELRGAMSMTDLNEIWTARQAMMKHHYKAALIEDAKTVAAEMKIKLTPAVNQ